MQLQAELRRRWRAWIGLALLIGVAGGVSLTAVAGARRTETAYPRFLRAARAPDVVSGGVSGPEEAFLPGIEALKRLPQVAEWEDSYALPGEIITDTGRSVSFPQLRAGGDDDATVTVARGVMPGIGKILRGRIADPSSTDEATLSFTAEAPDLTVGHTVTIALAEDAGFEKGTRIAVRIVGIHAAPGEFQSVNGISFPGLVVSAGTIRKHLDALKSAPQSNVFSLSMSLKPGYTVDDLRTEAEKRGIVVDLPLEIAEHEKGVQKTMRFEAAALWMLAALAAVATLAIFGQALARVSLMEAVEYPTLRALGMSRTSLAAIGVMRSLAIGVVGGAVAVVTALAASPLTPIGAARIAEPDPGFHADVPVLALGGLGVVVAVVLAALLPAIRAARVGGGLLGTAEPARIARVSFSAAAFARASAPPSVVSGVRLALEAGRGRTAVPVRTTIAGVATAIAALVMALTFRSSLDELIRSPALSGYTWDALLAGPPGPELVEAFRSSPQVADAAQGGATNVIVDGKRMLSFVWEPGSSIGPVILEGRIPAKPNEVALGSTTLRQSGLRIGDRVEVSIASAQDSENVVADKAEYAIVGRAIIPQLFFEPHEPGEGAAMTIDAYFRLETPNRDEIPALVRVRDGVDLGAFAQEQRKHAFVAVRQTRGDMVTIERLSSVPLALAGFLAAMAAATLVHALLSTIRRRRRDLAILKTLGFRRRQIRTTVLWQSATLVLASCVFAIPAGVIAGRALWRLFANQIAVLPRPAVPVGWVLALLPAGLLIAALAALLPARAAGRTKAASVLRTE